MHPEIAAYHEAGHYVIAWFYEIPRKGLSIRPEIDSRARATIALGGSTIWDFACVMLAGPIAHNLYYLSSFGSLPAFFEGAETDIKDLIEVYNEVYKTNIRPEKWREEPEQLDEANAQALEFFHKVSESTDKLLIKYWPAVTRLARELVTKETLTNQQADTIIWNSLIAWDIASKFPKPLSSFIEKLLYELYSPFFWILVKCRLPDTIVRLETKIGD